MSRLGIAVLAAGAAIAPALMLGRLDHAAAAFPAAAGQGTPDLARITVDYPEEGSVFPPEITPPTFLWHDAAESAQAWRIDVAFAGSAGVLTAKAGGEPMRIGEIDPRCVGPTNELPKLTPYQATAHTWTPDEKTWAAIKRNSVERAATITITGFRDRDRRDAVSRGQVTILTSKDPVGAPIFYRDVPLMPSELEKGVIKPLAASAVPLIAWRLRNVGQTENRLLMDGLPTCANCHSFSSDGKTLGMDLDGPQNDKGMYAIARVAPRMSIRNEEVIRWSWFTDEQAGRMRVGFMSQVSPDGQFVVTTVSINEKELNRSYYVANFKDYRFLQVFYATRGILVVYNRATGRRQPLPGADDPRYVHTNAVWSPDGQYLVFARAEARDAYPENRPMAEYANDPNETPIQYDLYRIPFNGGKGGPAEPIAGASANGMSNSFPKISPDGRWIVFVQSRNGLLMRPDSRLYIVPAAGGRARPMRCNLDRMNSWHSFSPNGRWMVFSSKSRTPYTQMFLTHIGEDGRDSPAILIENATLANRAVNIPEFVNIPPDGLRQIDIPAVEFYRLFERALDFAKKGQFEAAVAGWKQALEMSPDDAIALNNFGVALARTGKVDEAIAQWKRAAELNDEYSEVHRNLGRALLPRGDIDGAILHFRKALETRPGDVSVRDNLGVALLQKGLLDEAIPEFLKALEANPKDTDAHYNLGLALLKKGRFDEAIGHYRSVLDVLPADAQTHNDLGVALLRKGRLGEAMAHFGKAIEANDGYTQARINLGNVLYMSGKAPEAVAEWRKALRAEPDNLAVLHQTAWVLATSPNDALRDGGEALRLAERAARVSGAREPEILDTLAAAYAESGRCPEAAETARRALALAEAQNKPALAAALKARIGLYEARRPFRDVPR